MIGKDNILKLLNTAVGESKADTTEILFIGSESGLTRYANSYIHQNMAELDSRITFRVSMGKKIGVVTTNVLEKRALNEALESAIEAASHARPNPNFKQIAGKSKIKNIKTFYDATAGMTPAGRAGVVGKICKAASKKGLIASGAFATSKTEIAFVNSRGVSLYKPLSSADINIIVSSENSSGYAQAVSRRVDKIDFDKLAQKAIEKCLLSRDPIDLEPGKYDVFLEPMAVANLLEWLSFIAFSAVAYHDKTSFLSGKKNKKVMAPAISIYDDGYDSSSVAFPFDLEGMAKKKVWFVKKGLGGGPVYDLQTAAKYKTKSTGHGMITGGASGPIPLNIFMLPGRVPSAKIISRIKKGVLVTRFHYINGYLDTPKALMTGMTRDGTFLIEDGKLKAGIRNLRFTESITRAFSNVQAVTKESELCDSWWSDIGCISAPGLHIKDFTFSGKTGAQ